MKKLLTFWRDEDGLTAKDALTVLFTVVYVLEQVTLFVLSLFGIYSEKAVGITNMLDATMITIIGGVFGLHSVKEFTKAKYPSDKN